MPTHSSVLAWRIPGMGSLVAAVYGVAQSQTRLKWLSCSNRLVLRQCQLVEAHNPQAVSQQDLVHMTVQIDWGMSYLSSRGVIHQDVAVGNCIAEDTLQVKISDNAVSRDLFPMDYVIAWGTMKTGGFGGRPLKVWLIMSSPVPVTCGPSEWCCGS